MAPARRSLVVLGHGMVGHKFVTAALDRGLTAEWDITVLGEESRPAYDRVALSTVFAGSSAEDLSLLPDGHYPDPAVTLELRAQVTGIDRAGRSVTLADGRVVPYDVLVLATGSYPFVPPVPGREARNCFVYRTIDDLDAIRARRRRCHRGRGDRRRPARPGGRERAAQPGPDHARGGDRPAPDAAAGRRRRRRRCSCVTSRRSGCTCTSARAPRRSSPTSAARSRSFV